MVSRQWLNNKFIHFNRNYFQAVEEVLARNNNNNSGLADVIARLEKDKTSGAEVMAVLKKLEASSIKECWVCVASKWSKSEGNRVNRYLPTYLIKR